MLRDQGPSASLPMLSSMDDLREDLPHQRSSDDQRVETGVQRRLNQNVGCTPVVAQQPPTSAVEFHVRTGARIKPDPLDQTADVDLIAVVVWEETRNEETRHPLVCRGGDDQPVRIRGHDVALDAR